MREEWRSVLPVVARLPRYGRLVFGLARDRRLKPGQKAALAGAVLYNVSPLDLVPGVVPVLGQLDDLMVLLFTVRTVLATCPDRVVREHLQRSGLTARQVRRDPEVVQRLLWRMVVAPRRIAGRCLADGARVYGAARKQAGGLGGLLGNKATRRRNRLQ